MAFVEQDSFAAVADVEALVQRGSFMTDTVPTLQQVVDFLAKRAGILELLLASRGVSVTVPSGARPFDPKSPLGKTLTAMNACAAAVDAVMAYEAGEAPVTSEKVKALLGVYAEMEKALEPLLASLAETPAAGGSVPVSCRIGVAPNVWTMTSRNW